MPRGQFKNPEERIRKIKLARAKQVIVHSKTTNKKIGEANKRLFKLGLRSHKGKNNPMYGKHYPQCGFQKGHQDFVSKEGRERQALKVAGEKCHFWKGGTTKTNLLIRKQREHRVWRKEVFEYDNYTCWICEDRNGNGHGVILNPHHLKKFSDYPKLRFEVNNGLTLCEFCHRTYTDFGNKPTEIKKGQHLSSETEFKKGLIPWNKDKKGYKLSKTLFFRI